MTVISLFVLFVWINVIANTDAATDTTPLRRHDPDFPPDVHKVSPCRSASDCFSIAASCRRFEMFTGVRSPAVCCEFSGHDMNGPWTEGQCLCNLECKEQGGKPARPSIEKCGGQNMKCGNFYPSSSPRKCCEGLTCKWNLASLRAQCVTECVPPKCVPQVPAIKMCKTRRDCPYRQSCCLANFVDKGDHYGTCSNGCPRG